MIVNINNVDFHEVAERDEAVGVIKKEMKGYMQKGDYLGWTYYGIDEEGQKPNMAFVVNEVGEETDDFALITGGKLT